MPKQRKARPRRPDLSDPVADCVVLHAIPVRLLGRALIALRYERFGGRPPRFGELADWVQSLVDRELLDVPGAVRSSLERQLVHGDDSREVVREVLGPRRRAGGAA